MKNKEINIEKIKEKLNNNVPLTKSEKRFIYLATFCALPFISMLVRTFYLIKGGKKKNETKN